MTPDENKPPKPKFKNRSERNAGFKSDAQIIFEGRQLLEKRPEFMSRDEYRLIRKMQSEILKQLFRKGHAPNRKLQGIMGTKQPSVRIISAPKRKINAPRKSG